MRRMIVALCSVALLIAVAAPAASATLPQRVTITSVMTYAEGGHSFGTFEATGPAVTRHLICPSGQVRDIYLLEVAGGWDVVKAFVCADGSQSFIVRLQVKNNENGETFTWAIKGGTGPYRGLFGTGSGTSTPWDWESGGHLTNTYTGTMVGG
jgi:hypothetical protein